MRSLNQAETPTQLQTHLLIYRSVELNFQSAEQSKSAFVQLHYASQWPEALRWHTDWLTLEWVGISKFITTSTCGMSRPLLATSVASRIERALALNLFREPNRLFWKRRTKREWQNNALLVKMLLLKYFYYRTGRGSTQKLHFSNFILNYYRISCSIHIKFLGISPVHLAVKYS